MNITFKNIVKKNIPTELIQPKRAMVYVGFQCHQKCGFCYYKHKCSEPMFDFDVVRKQIDFEYDYGIREFEITGGEPSESKTLYRVCQYIKQKDKHTKIAIITNGGLWKSDVWDLIDEVLVSYHTCRDDFLLDKKIFPFGSTYNKVRKTVDLAHSLGKLVRTNTVCATFNMSYLDKIVDDLLSFKPVIINFLPVNLFDQARCEMDKYIDYAEFRPIIKQQLDKINSRSNCMTNIRYMPFCDMEGYEKHIVGHLQHIYDEHDWNRELDGVSILNMIENYNIAMKNLGKYGSTSVNKAFELRDTFYEKDARCFTCKYQLICDGVEKTPDHRLLKDIIPSRGKIIKNCMQFRSPRV